ncbi:DUF4878 domain-containing protein [Gordonia sp. VNK21]|uniref:DUF4878 domain-containing protein n=1 Tax=Gordonia sp. VNK21 TaxID=3382483 RepID=UPI0038D49DFA
MQKKLYRPTMGIVAVAAGAALVLTGCSDDNDSKDSTTSAATSAVTSGATDTSTADASDADDSSSLSQGDAQKILDEATNPDTSDDDLAEVADVSAPGTKEALSAYAKAMKAAGYTHTVKSVAADGADKATVTVNIADPSHPERAADVPLAFVKVDGDWKLAGDAITQLSAMAGAHSGH